MTKGEQNPPDHKNIMPIRPKGPIQMQMIMKAKDLKIEKEKTKLFVFFWKKKNLTKAHANSYP